jgi:mono/diheme cytochrome c family protein
MTVRSILFALLLALTGSTYACRQKVGSSTVDLLDHAYDVEQDSNDPQRRIPLRYDQAQGKRVFYEKCIWCHSDATPAGPSNRANLAPQPPLFNDGNAMNPLSDTFIRNIVTLGGSAVGKSAMMPPWGETLSPEEIRALVGYIRVMAQPPFVAPERPALDSAVK